MPPPRSERYRQYARAIVRSLRRGDLFPAAGRVPPRDAPGGTTRTIERFGRSELDHLETSVHRVALPGLSRPVRILHVTDVHLREPDAWSERLAARVAAVPCDLVLITGDVVTRGWTVAAVDQLLGALPAAPLGRWAVIGNWERWSGATPETWAPLLARHGVRLLLDESVEVDGLTLVGTDDALSGTPDLARAFRDVSTQRPCVVLTHSPALFTSIRPYLPSGGLVLAGHTHGGQVRLPVVGPVFLPRQSGAYPWGWYGEADTWLFVGRGLGWSVAPFRWRCPPELARIDVGATLPMT